MPVVVYPFRYRHELTGKWVHARYKADLNEIAARHAEWEITGPPETRGDIGEAFSPHRPMTSKVPREEAAAMQPHLQQPPAIDIGECFLLGLFLRRYVTYCARRRRYATMNGATKLFMEVGAVKGRPIQTMAPAK